MRTAWVFDGYSFPTNPDDDSGWVFEPIYSEKNAIAASSSRYQFTSMKSARRQISGYFYGPSAIEQRDQFEVWVRNRTQASLVDHLGVSRRAMMIKFDAKPIQDVRAYVLGRATFRFTAEFVAV